MQYETSVNKPKWGIKMIDFYGLFMGFLILVGATYVIMYACNQFEPAADYLGRNLGPGLKGATINAVGSSFPELATAVAFMFTIDAVNVTEGFLSALAVTAGSAVFNGVIIPACVILAVTVFGTKTEMGRKTVQFISIKRSTILRDGLFLLACEALLIYFLSLPIVSISTGLILIGGYVLYSGYLYYQIKTGVIDESELEDDEDDEDDDDDDTDVPVWRQIIEFDFINLFFGGKISSNGVAWTVLGLSIALLGVACHYLAESVVMLADVMGVAPFISAVIFGAAATSVPDTIISIKDAQKGNYDDAVANALGSNIFDITVCTGFPVLLYTIMVGPIELITGTGLDEAVQGLRIFLLGITAVVFALFLMNTRVTSKTAYIMLGLYAAWIGYIIHAA